MVPSRKGVFLTVVVSALCFVLGGCQTTSPQGSPDAEMQKALAGVKAKTADDLLVVDCLLPGQIRKLGKKMVYLTPRRAIKTTALECEIRGGEYVAYDRADYRTALQTWLPQAQQGDPEAQTYVGEIYEKGLGTTPDYKKAAMWYRKAAEKGYGRAQINLGYLYEKGLGVPRDPKEALKWYRKAAGADTDIALDESGLSRKERKELERLRRQSSLNRTQMAALRRRLQQTQRALDRARKQLVQHLEQLETRKPAPTPAPPKPARPDKDLLRLKKELKQRQAELEREREQMKQLQDRLVGLKAQSAGYRQQMEEVRQQQEKVKKLEEQMSAARRELETARADIEKQRRAIEEERRKLEEAKKEWERRQAEARQQSAASDQGSARSPADDEAYRRQQEEIRALQQQIASLKTTSEQLRMQLAQANQSEVEVAGPDIEIIQPPVVVTRGVKIIPTGTPAKAQEIVGKVTAPAGLFSFTVNGTPQKVEKGGLFRARLPLMRGGQTPVEIVAVDTQGKRAAVEIVLARSSIKKADIVVPEAATKAQSTPPAIDFGSYYALIIGNDHYRHFPNLTTAGNDAKAIDQVLRTQYGFKTRLLIDATRYQILSALNHYREQLTEKDNLLIYYAGHGDLDKVNLRGYWLPVDAEPDNTANWISNVAITDILNAMSAKQILVIADSCYSGALTRSAIARLQAGQSNEARFNWLRLMAKKRSRTVLTSGELKPVLDAGGGDHSVFAKALLEVLQANKDILEGQKLYREVSARVSYAAERFGIEQVPQYAPIRHAGHEAGDFFFVPKAT